MLSVIFFEHFFSLRLDERPSVPTNTSDLAELSRIRIPLSKKVRILANTKQFSDLGQLKKTSDEMEVC